MRLKISLLILGLFTSVYLHAQEAQISFKIKNAGIFVNGTFDSIQVIQRFKPEDITAVRFMATIPVSTINTGIKSRDRHLLKVKYFDQKNYPNILFESTKVNSTTQGYQLRGRLTIKNTTLDVIINFTIESIEGLNYYKGYLELDRRDYGVGKNHLILGNLVRITINIPVEPS